MSLTLTPLRGHRRAGRAGTAAASRCRATGHAILFARSIAAVLPDDLDPELALAVLDVCGAPALTARVVAGATAAAGTVVAVIGGAGKSGSLSLAAARGPAPAVPSASSRTPRARALAAAGLADAVALADARDPVALSAAVTAALGGPADVTVVCVDVPGCEHGAILATAARRHGHLLLDGDLASPPPRSAPKGLAADVTMLIGNGYVPGHAEFALRPGAGGARGAGAFRRPGWRHMKHETAA